MANFHSQRLQEVVYQPRHHTLVAEYITYVTHPTPDTPAFDVLPHIADLCCFPPFQDVIMAPEEHQMSDKSFATAFSQLPPLVGEWRNKLDAEVAALVKIPSCLSLGNASTAQVVASSSTTSTGSSQTNMNKLHLACALFNADRGAYTYPEVLLVSMHHHHFPNDAEDNLERIGSIKDRFFIKFVVEAPYIVHVCGLDPNVAPADDMDHRNARLRCLYGSQELHNIVMDWRQAVSLPLH